MAALNSIAHIEDTILSVVNDRLKNYLRATASLPGAWSVDLLKLLLQQAPGVFVAFVGGEFDGNTVTLLNARFDVYVVTKEPTELSRRRGSPVVLGAYEIIQALLPYLNNLTIPGYGSLRGKSVTNLFANILTELGGTVYGMSFELPRMPILAETNDEMNARLGDFAILNINTSLTTPGADDFTTIINLPQGGN